jgi:hypothetical protein
MRTYSPVLVIILLIIWTTVSSQNFESGLPFSKTSFCPQAIANAIISSKIHTGLSTQTLLQESSTNSNLKNRFSVGYAESINLTEDGLWSDLPNGDRSIGHYKPILLSETDNGKDGAARVANARHRMVKSWRKK